MALLSCSLRACSPPLFPSCSGGKFGDSCSGRRRSRVILCGSSSVIGRAQSSLCGADLINVTSFFRGKNSLFNVIKSFWSTPGSSGEEDSAPLFPDERQVEGRDSGTVLGSCAVYTPGIASFMPLSAITMHDLIASVLTIAGALSLLKSFDELAKRDVLDKKLSRKLVHIVVGLGFMLFWPLFSYAPIAKYLCALAPAGNGVRMLGLGFGLLQNDAMIKAMSREGDRRELLKGPFYYALAIVVTTVCFWRSSPIGIVALVNLCAGDGTDEVVIAFLEVYYGRLLLPSGFADIIGRNFGGAKLPWNSDKSYAGSMAMFIASTVVSLLYLQYFAYFGFIHILPGTFAGVAIVSFLTTIVESMPISTRLDDNLTVPFAAIALGMLILPS